LVTLTRVHYEIPDDLHRKVKSLAAVEGLTLKDFVILALTEAVKRREEPKKKR
jgi:hypothetical protein